MPDELTEEPTEAAENNAKSTSPAAPHPSDGPIFTGLGIGSAVLGVVAVVAVVLGILIGIDHRAEVADRTYQSRVLQAAADWTGVLINMNKDTVTPSMNTLHDGTIGELNSNFESAVKPFSEVVQKLQSQTVGQVESVAIESLYHARPGAAGRAEPPPELSTVASRTDNVIVAATSVSQNAGAKPLTVHWTLRLSVSDVDDKFLVSRLETIR